MILKNVFNGKRAISNQYYKLDIDYANCFKNVRKTLALLLSCMSTLEKKKNTTFDISTLYYDEQCAQINYTYICQGFHCAKKTKIFDLLSFKLEKCFHQE